MKLKSTLFFIIFAISFVFAEQINSKKLYEVIQKKNFRGVILDIRTPVEWKKSGIIKGAITKNAYGDDFKSFIKRLDKSKTYYVYCHSGGRSVKVHSLMTENGIKAFDMNYGISGWLKNKLPTVQYIDPSNIKQILKKN